MEETNCCVCGVKIYIDDDFYNTLKTTHKSFYCINGHSQHFVGETEAEKQKKINKIITEESNKRIEELKGRIAVLSKNTHQCLYCNKFFSSAYNLNRHISDKHKKSSEKKIKSKNNSGAKRTKSRELIG